MQKLMTAQEVADLVCARSRKWVYKLAAEGQIPSVRLTDGTVRFIAKEIEEWVESRRTRLEGQSRD